MTLYRGYYWSEEFDAICEVTHDTKWYKCDFTNRYEPESTVTVISAWDRYTGEEIDPSLINPDEVDVDLADGPINYDPEPEPYEYNF